MKRMEQIGFSQRIQLDWLEYTANLVLTGNQRDKIVSELNELLREKLSVGNEPERGNRHKAITILTKVWVAVPGELQTLRDEGLDLLQRVPANDRMLVHWCMCMAVYPFFGTVADATGRLLRLQGVAGAAQIQRRLREQLGERETVARAARRILRTFIDWGVLLQTDKKGLYRGANKHAVHNPQLSIWALKAKLSAKRGTLRPAAALIHGPDLFPFDIALPSVRELETCDAIEITRHGLNHEVLFSLSSELPC